MTQKELALSLKVDVEESIKRLTQRQKELEYKKEIAAGKKFLYRTMIDGKITENGAKYELMASEQSDLIDAIEKELHSTKAELKDKKEEKTLLESWA
jgi:hypothetical protein